MADLPVTPVSGWQREIADHDPTEIFRFGDPNLQDKLLLVHGGPGMDHSYFQGAVEGLSDQFELITYTQGKRVPPTIQALVSELDGVIRKFNHHRVHLLGHSFGGALVLEWINANPTSRISSLILVSHVIKPNWSRNSLVRHSDLYQGWQERLGRMESQLGDELFREQMITGVDLYFTPRLREKGVEILARGSCNDRLKSAIFAEYLSSFDLTSLLPHVHFPTLVIAGQNDVIVDPEHTKETSSLIPGAKYTEISDARHFPFIEKPSEFNAILRAFTSSIPL